MKKLTLLLIITTQLTLACPIHINNDSTSPIIIVDPHGTEALYLDTGQGQVIDPSLAPLWYHFPLKYFKKETLHVYVQQNNGRYKLIYILQEDFCAPGIEELSLSTIKKMVKVPTDRYTVEKINHKNNETEHAH